MSCDPELFSFGRGGRRRHGGAGEQSRAAAAGPAHCAPSQLETRTGCSIWMPSVEGIGYGGEKPLRDFRCKNYWEFLQSPLPRWRLTAGPRNLQPTQALRRLPSQITLIELQIASRIRCSFQLNPRLSISILFGEFKWCAYSYCQPGYGVRKGVVIAHLETKSRSVDFKTREGDWRSS